MSDAIHVVADYDDLAAAEKPTERARTHIATLLSNRGRDVVWLPEWLVGDKALEASDVNPQLFVGVVMDYSDKALRVRQSGQSDYVPKSEVEAFRLADGVGAIDTPQTGLGSFAEER